MKIIDKRVVYNEMGEKLQIKIGNKYRDIVEWFQEYPPKITYVDGSTLENRYYLEFGTKGVPIFNKQELITLDWTGTNIRKESQGIYREKDTVQYKIIETIKEKDYDIIFDDDGSGEIADVVAIKNENEKIYIDLYHCKYSKEDNPGSRIGDLYEVCGQAQKSVNWKISAEKIFKHLLKRERLRNSRQNDTRFEVGDETKLNAFVNMARLYQVEMNIYVVQPGVSKEKISHEQLELLGVTQTWLFETLGVKLYVIVSE